jgi:hypothetical protein
VLSQKVLICLYVLTIIDIALDVWLEEHFAETARDIETEFQAPDTLQIPEIIHVTSKHPIYHFRQGDLVAFVSGDGLEGSPEPLEHVGLTVDLGIDTRGKHEWFVNMSNLVIVKTSQSIPNTILNTCLVHLCYCVTRGGCPS